MTAADLTRGHPVTPAERRHRVIVLALLITLCALALASGWLAIDNRSTGRGISDDVGDLRVVDCTILEAVAPDKVLAECPRPAANPTKE